MEEVIPSEVDQLHTADLKENNCNNIDLLSIYVYGWGKNKHGELGLGHTYNISEPIPIKSLQGSLISQISSGGKHTACITNEGQLYICGSDVLGLLGNEDENSKWKESHKFKILTMLDTEVITMVACAEFHSLCLTDEGFVYAWGGNLHNVNIFFILEDLGDFSLHYFYMCVLHIPLLSTNFMD